MMQLAGHLPPILVVGIGYRRGALQETIEPRTRDLSPTPDHGFSGFFPELSNMGGAAATLGFIRDELMPWVDARFAVRPGDSTYFGHSLAGLFGTYVLLTAPETFRRYAIASPSLWWDDGVIKSFEDAYAEAHEDLPAKAYFGIGADETYEGRQHEASRYPDEMREKATAWPFDMVADMNELVRRLEARRYAGLELTSAVFADEFHVTVAPLVLSRAAIVVRRASLSRPITTGRPAPA